MSRLRKDHPLGWVHSHWRKSEKQETAQQLFLARSVLSLNLIQVPVVVVADLAGERLQRCAQA